MKVRNFLIVILSLSVDSVLSALCGSDDDCIFLEYCNLDGVCALYSTPCHSSDDCPVKKYCTLDGVCDWAALYSTPCHSSEDCPVKKYCTLDGVCDWAVLSAKYKICDSDDDCMDAQYCDRDGVCALYSTWTSHAPCGEGDACPAGEICTMDGYCVPCSNLLDRDSCFDGWRSIYPKDRATCASVCFDIPCGCVDGGVSHGMDEDGCCAVFCKRQPICERINDIKDVQKRKNQCQRRKSTCRFVPRGNLGVAGFCTAKTKSDVCTTFGGGCSLNPSSWINDNDRCLINGRVDGRVDVCTTGGGCSLNPGTNMNTKELCLINGRVDMCTNFDGLRQDVDDCLLNMKDLCLINGRVDVCTTISGLHQDVNDCLLQEGRKCNSNGCDYQIEYVSNSYRSVCAKKDCTVLDKKQCHIETECAYTTKFGGGCVSKYDDCNDFVHYPGKDLCTEANGCVYDPCLGMCTTIPFDQ